VLRKAGLGHEVAGKHPLALAVHNPRVGGSALHHGESLAGVEPESLRERKAKGEKWGAAELDAFLKKPSAYLAGTSMSFAGVARPDQRADIIAYLASLK
jgi:mono/diheme cytochrome c family protein